MKPIRIWPVVVWAGVGILILCALGVWQIFRLQEKQALLAEIAARTQGPATSLANIMQRHEPGSDIEFLAVTVRGNFDHTHELHKLTSFEGAPGWQIITPFTTTDGIAVLVDRGVVPDGLRDPAKRPEPAAESEIKAIVRTHQSARGYFDGENDDVKNQWYWWDVPAMLAASAIPADKKIAPFVLQVLPNHTNNGYPRPLPPETNLSNNHLQYIIIWFSLAVVLAVIAGIFIARQIRRSDA